MLPLPQIRWPAAVPATLLPQAACQPLGVEEPRGKSAFIRDFAEIRLSFVANCNDKCKANSRASLWLTALNYKIINLAVVPAMAGVPLATGEPAEEWIAAFAGLLHTQALSFRGGARLRTRNPYSRDRCQGFRACRYAVPRNDDPFCAYARSGLRRSNALGCYCELRKTIGNQGSGIVAPRVISDQRWR
jgi:hypothetical protein